MNGKILALQAALCLLYPLSWAPCRVQARTVPLQEDTAVFQETDNKYGGATVLTPESGFASLEADLGDTAAMSARVLSAMGKGFWEWSSPPLAQVAPSRGCAWP